MSRAYHLSITIGPVTPGREEAVQKAANQEWDELHWFNHEGVYTAYGDGTLYSGQTEEEYAEYFAGVIWQAHGGYVEMTIHLTYLEDLPCETFQLDEASYTAWVKAEQKGGKSV